MQKVGGVVIAGDEAEAEAEAEVEAEAEAEVEAEAEGEEEEEEDIAAAEERALEVLEQQKGRPPLFGNDNENGTTNP
jgi:hypothetical protein